MREDVAPREGCVNVWRYGDTGQAVLGGTGTCQGLSQAEHRLDVKNSRCLGHGQSPKDVEECGIMGNRQRDSIRQIRSSVAGLGGQVWLGLLWVAGL